MEVKRKQVNRARDEETEVSEGLWTTRRAARAKGLQPKNIPAEEPEDLWDTFQVARALGLRPKTIRQYCWMRKIPFLKIGRSVRFVPSTIRKILDEASIPARESL
jgi:hypothetical protein